MNLNGKAAAVQIAAAFLLLVLEAHCHDLVPRQTPFVGAPRAVKGYFLDYPKLEKRPQNFLELLIFFRYYLYTEALRLLRDKILIVPNRNTFWLGGSLSQKQTGDNYNS